MSGGAFNYWVPDESYVSEWKDLEINDMIEDLFFNGEFSCRDYGGLFLSLDFYLCGDICEETYREYVKKFKDKWFKRSDSDRAEFYCGKIQEYADLLKKEMMGIG